MLKAYLAGAIRTPADFEWRQDLLAIYEGRLQCLVPSDIGVDDWTKILQFKPSAYMTYRTDLFLIDQCDIVIANLTAIDENYPSIGTLIEIGYAIKAGKPVLLRVGEKTKSHPFLAFGAQGAFTCWLDLYYYLDALIQITDGHCMLVAKE